MVPLSDPVLNGSALSICRFNDLVFSFTARFLLRGERADVLRPLINCGFGASFVFYF